MVNYHIINTVRENSVNSFYLNYERKQRINNSNVNSIRINIWYSNNNFILMKKLTKQQEDTIARAVRLASSEAINSEYIAAQMEIDAYNDLYGAFYAD